MESKIFVYGSLKPGGWLHYLIEDSVERPQSGWVKGDMYNVGGRYPALALGSDSRVHGILYYVRDDIDREVLFQRLDRAEGYPTLFDRMSMLVYGEPFGAVMATVYYGVDDRLFKNPIVENGIWEVS